MKRVLFVTPYNPFEWPLGAASQSVAYRLSHLAEIADVEVVTFHSLREMGETDARLNNIKRHVVPYPPRVLEKQSPLTRLYQILCGNLELFKRMETLSAALGDLAASRIDRKAFDLIHIDDLIIHAVAGYFPVSQRKIFFCHNLMTLQYRNLYRSRRTALRKLLSFIEYLHIKRYETKALSSMRTVVVLTRPEEKTLRALSPHTTVFRIPLEIDHRLYHPDPRAGKPYRVVFTGTMSYEPNHEGAIFFIKEILPLILRKCPQTRFFVVGMNPPANLLAFEGNNVTITGAVPSVIEYLKEASVVVVPLLTGGGMRFKILEAFAMAKAIVSTSVGAEGIEYQDRVNILIADDPLAFAEAVVSLLNNPQQARAIGEEGRNLVERVYSTVVVKRQWQELYHRL